MKTHYSFGLVRYVHDPVAGEFVNVGVIVYAPAASYLKARCTRRYGRASKFFGEVRGTYFKSLMDHVERQVNRRGSEVSGLPFDSPPEHVYDAIRSLFVIDDSSLQFADGGGGLTRDPEETLAALFDRFVGQFEQEPAKGRDDSDIWRHFRKPLEATGVTKHLSAHKVEAPLFSYEFEHAWKNGIWHALEPLSFDLSSPESVRDKATKWAGRAIALQDASEELTLHYLVGRPARTDLARAYDDALGILGRSPIPHRIVPEEKAEELAELLRKEIVEST